MPWLGRQVTDGQLSDKKIYLQRQGLERRASEKLESRRSLTGYSSKRVHLWGYIGVFGLHDRQYGECGEKLGPESHGRRAILLR